MVIMKIQFLVLALLGACVITAQAQDENAYIVSSSDNLILKSSQSIQKVQSPSKSLQTLQPQNEHPRVVSESLEFSHHQSSGSSQDIHVRKESTLISKMSRPNHYPASSKRHSNRKSNKATHGIQNKAELSDEQMKLDSFKRE